MTDAGRSLSAATETPRADGLKVVAVETFLADVAQQVAGERLKVTALMPIGVDPHSFEPTPVDVKKVADCNVLIVNGAGFEEFLDELLENAGGTPKIIEASAGLAIRDTKKEEAAEKTHAHSGGSHEGGHHHEGDLTSGWLPAI